MSILNRKTIKNVIKLSVAVLAPIAAAYLKTKLKQTAEEGKEKSQKTTPENAPTPENAEKPQESGKVQESEKSQESEQPVETPKADAQIKVSDAAGKAINIIEKTGCKIAHIVSCNNITEDQLTDLYLRMAEQPNPGFVRVMVELDSILIDNLLIEYEDHLSDMESFIQSKLNTPLEDAESILKNRFEETKEIYTSDGDMDWDNDMIAWGEESSDCGSLETLILSQSDNLLCFVDVPVQSVYDVFCYLPFGGAESPEPLEHRSIAKYWFEKYGAVPCFMSGDVLQFYVKQPVNEEEEVKALALQQFGFCSDIVTQGCETVQNLASSLKDSRFWYFWWD
ncbi:MAG: DUF4253 domain-containing protein [Paludibacteraceae bacterium]|nr:DUF4253 domain-containing protein [Paludibacteraceae bacterium]